MGKGIKKEVGTEVERDIKKLVDFEVKEKLCWEAGKVKEGEEKKKEIKK